MTEYVTFVAFAALLAVAPGPDSFLTLRATVAGGRRRGLVTAAGITTAGAIQGLLAATGLGAVLLHAEPVFLAIRWAGVAYLTWLGVTAIRDALRRDGSVWTVGASGATVSARRAFRQGFVCNITNPKVLAFNLAVLPQFVGDDPGVPVLLAYALTLVGIGAIVLVTLVQLGSLATDRLTRPAFRRGVDGVTGVVMLGFATALAVEA
ncbi:LysE family translocator [Aeromicrobium fastidiosum]|uniref:LysE family translocator n=1 Tax=Aeromicrobium fastidiosum TaxID=52699 RepID=A0A641AQF8_9ACTN|nr:LysE family translocator [Aeromicrobium fastidiosum]KAA1380336.1 LysE family translocator [Aeromicrobium fastidiosum]MBP2389898.1 threonine/homoserine/homoserine lactone efflux protein [Aeromicrobium fastidiosum]